MADAFDEISAGVDDQRVAVRDRPFVQHAPADQRGARTGGKFEFVGGRIFLRRRNGSQIRVQRLEIAVAHQRELLVRKRGILNAVTADAEAHRVHEFVERPVTDAMFAIGRDVRAVQRSVRVRKWPAAGICLSAAARVARRAVADTGEIVAARDECGVGFERRRRAARNAERFEAALRDKQESEHDDSREITRYEHEQKSRTPSHGVLPRQRTARDGRRETAGVGGLHAFVVGLGRKDNSRSR